MDSQNKEVQVIAEQEGLTKNPGNLSTLSQTYTVTKVCLGTSQENQEPRRHHGYCPYSSYAHPFFPCPILTKSFNIEIAVSKCVRGK
jgi:hypothetical protein